MACGASSDIPMSEGISPLRVIAAGASWRMFGSRRAGSTLLRAMSADNEQNRMLAGMSLVKAGQRSFDLIEEKVKAGEAAAPVIRLLPDIDGQKHVKCWTRLHTVSPARCRTRPGSVSIC